MSELRKPTQQELELILRAGIHGASFVQNKRGSWNYDRGADYDDGMFSVARCAVRYLYKVAGVITAMENTALLGQLSEEPHSLGEVE